MTSARGSMLLSIAVRFAVWGVLLSTCSSPGDPCGSNADCSGNLVCVKLEVDGGPSERGVCSHAGADLGGFCRATADCRDGLICANELPSTTKRGSGLCIPFREEAESCARSESCRPPLQCLLAASDNGICGVPSASDAASPPDADADADAGAP